jgi:hypothetical protein
VCARRGQGEEKGDEARPGTSACALWRVLGVLGASWLAAAGFCSSYGGVQRVQGSEREVADMVVHGGWERRGEWHGEGMTCHDMVKMVMISCPNPCLWYLA